MGTSMIVYRWTCACGITIEADTNKRINTAKERHYRIHAKEAGWEQE